MELCPSCRPTPSRSRCVQLDQAAHGSFDHAHLQLLTCLVKVIHVPADHSHQAAHVSAHTLRPYNHTAVDLSTLSHSPVLHRAVSAF